MWHGEAADKIFRILTGKWQEPNSHKLKQKGGFIGRIHSQLTELKEEWQRLGALWESQGSKVRVRCHEDSFILPLILASFWPQNLRVLVLTEGIKKKKSFFSSFHLENSRRKCQRSWLDQKPIPIAWKSKSRMNIIDIFPIITRLLLFWKD